MVFFALHAVSRLDGCTTGRLPLLCFWPPGGAGSSACHRALPAMTRAAHHFAGLPVHQQVILRAHLESGQTHRHGPSRIAMPRSTTDTAASAVTHSACLLSKRREAVFGSARDLPQRASFSASCRMPPLYRAALFFLTTKRTLRS